MDRATFDVCRRQKPASWHPGGMPEFSVWRSIGACLLIVLVTQQLVFADEMDAIQSLLAKYCLRCHGAEKQNAQVRFDRIARFENSDQRLWAMVHDSLVRGEMPPKDEPQPAPDEKQRILKWIIDEATGPIRLGRRASRVLPRVDAGQLRPINLRCPT
ncbi:MAG: hypothetical protein FJ302_15825 [Planctomycetes bacterium]|nr:hypothetical protein [Planctomycetota bacterium]